MKNIKNIVFGAALLLLSISQSFAGGAIVWTYGTNSIDFTTNQVTSWPTNVPTTNGVTFIYTNFVTAAGVTNATYTNTFYPGTLTGKFIEIDNQEHLVLTVEGWLQNGLQTGSISNNVIGIQLVTANTLGGPPGVGINALNLLTSINTNGTGASFYNMAQTDFESPTINAHWFLVPLPSQTTNWFSWSTNIIMDVAPGGLPNADWVGVYSITNNFSDARFSLINPLGIVGINKKVIPAKIQ